MVSWLVFRLEIDGLFGLYRMHPDGSHRQVILPPSSFHPSSDRLGRSARRRLR